MHAIVPMPLCLAGPRPTLLTDVTKSRQENTIMAATKKPNILILWGDDIGITNCSYFSRGMMGYRTPNIDRVANEGVAFTDYYGQQSCTAGRAPSICGQHPVPPCPNTTRIPA